MSLIGVDGRPIGEAARKPNTKNMKITQVDAGAIIISEIDIAITRWNEHNLQIVNHDVTRAPVIAMEFNKYEYSEAIKEAQQFFGYAKLEMIITYEGESKVVYSKGLNFFKENELNNDNGYFPGMAIDCLGFLLASAFMFNLATLKDITSTKKEPKNAKVMQRTSHSKGKSKPGDEPKTNKRDN